MRAHFFKAVIRVYVRAYVCVCVKSTFVMCTWVDVRSCVCVCVIMSQGTSGGFINL